MSAPHNNWDDPRFKKTVDFIRSCLYKIGSCEIIDGDV